MINLIHIELMKLKRSKTVLLNFLFIILFSPLLGCVIKRDLGWKVFLSESEDFMFLFAGMIVFIWLLSNIFLREYSNNSISSLYNCPVKMESIFGAKMIVVYIMMIPIYIIYFISIITMGKFNVKAHLGKAVLLNHLTAYIVSLLLLLAIVPILAFIINIIKNTAAVMILVILSNFIAYEKGWQGFWPLLLPYVPFYNMVKPIDIVLTGVLAIGTFVMGVGLCKIHLLYQHP